MSIEKWMHRLVQATFVDLGALPLEIFAHVLTSNDGLLPARVLAAALLSPTAGSLPRGRPIGRQGSVH